MIDYIYAQLAGLFQPYPPTFFPEVFMCKGGEQSYATFDSFRRTWTFDITYDRSNLSFSQLYFNLFVNLAGQKREDRVRLRIDKESYFEIWIKKRGNVVKLHFLFFFGSGYENRTRITCVRGVFLHHLKRL